MKSVFVSLGMHAGVGGMERFNQRVLRSLAEWNGGEGAETVAVALWDDPKCRERAPRQVLYVAAASSKCRAALSFLWHVWRLRPHVVLYGHVLLAPLAAPARLISPGTRHVLFVHGREVWREPFRRRVPVWERMAVGRLIDQVVSVSRLTVERMKEVYGLHEEVFRLLPNGIDIGAEEAPDPGRRVAPARLLTVARLGRLDRSKGCDKVILAMPHILREFPGVRYDIVGDGPLRSELEQLAREAGVGESVNFLGYVSDERLEEAYRRASLLVMPSYGEGFGIVFLEAWKHGLPVVVGNQDASSEVVTDGWNGLCVDPHSVSEIALAVRALLSDASRARAMGENGRRTVLENYTHGHFQRRLANILDAAAEEAGASIRADAHTGRG